MGSVTPTMHPVTTLKEEQVCIGQQNVDLCKQRKSSYNIEHH
jgi:hypothetical protein